MNMKLGILYEVRYSVGLTDCASFEDNEINRFNNKKEAVKYFNKMKRFEKDHEKGLVTDEEKDWGSWWIDGYGLMVKKVFGLYFVSHTEEKIK